MQKWMRYIIISKRFVPFTVISSIILIIMIAFIVKREDVSYSSHQLKYSVHFPEGWVKIHETEKEVSYHSFDVLPATDIPEAAILITTQQGNADQNLEAHFEIILNSVIAGHNRILNQGTTYIRLQEAYWVEFQDPNGLNNYILYALFNRAGDLLIIQSRISLLHLDKYHGVLQSVLESMEFKS